MKEQFGHIVDAGWHDIGVARRLVVDFVHLFLSSLVVTGYIDILHDHL